MVDLLSIKTQDTEQIELIWNNKNLEYQSETTVPDKRKGNEGELLNIDTYVYKNLAFIRYHNRLEIKGSLHYYFNNGLHNANYFSVIDCIAVIRELIQVFGLNPYKFTPNGMEWAINMQPEKEVNSLLRCFKFYGKKIISESQKYKNFFTAGSNYQSLKIYNKTQDCPLYALPNTLRFEAKTAEYKRLKSLGIKTLADLLTPETYGRLANHLYNEWQDVLIFDFNLSEFKDEQTTEYWQDAIYNKSRNTFINRKKDFIKRLPKNSLHFILDTQVKKEVQKIIDCAYSTSIEIDKSVFLDKIKYQKNNKISSKRKPQKKTSIVHIPTLVKSDIAQPPKPLKKEPRICIITGVDISTQKEDSFLLSHTGIKHLIKTDFNQFEKIRIKHLYPKFRFSDIKIQIKEIAHSIRDKNGIKKRNYNNNQTSIF